MTVKSTHSLSLLEAASGGRETTGACCAPGPDPGGGSSPSRSPALDDAAVTGRSIYLETFGCQMNELDSELVRGHLSALGYRFTRDVTAAQIILYNTCSVREQAENKVLSRLGELAIEKREGRDIVVGVLGCLAEREGPRMLGKYPLVDLMCGPGELDKLPMLLDNVYRTAGIVRADRMALQGSAARRTATLAAAEDNLEALDLSRAFDPDRNSATGEQFAAGRTAYVRITRGCNKFCTYCVVPNTRGPEVHRSPDAIVAECARLADRGVIEVTLLGQTINHYVYVHGAATSVGGKEVSQVGPGLKAFRTSSFAPTGSRTTTFADLLKRIHDEVPAIQRLRFVTSYPRDFSDETLQVMAESPRICRYLHVPAQSGSNRILKAMNRGYTVEQYLEFIDRARSFMPDVSLAGDIIVGFPGETDQDHEATRALLETVRFKNSFIFKYSPRPGTVAIDRFPDDIPDDVKRLRNNDLLDVQSRVSSDVHAEKIGSIQPVFVEKVSGRRSTAAQRSRGHGSSASPRVVLGWESGDETVQVSGRTAGDLIAVFDVHSQAAAENLVGQIVPVEITDSGPLLLLGELAAQPGDMPNIP